MINKIINELTHNMSSDDALERANNIVCAHSLGGGANVDLLVDSLTPTGGHAGIQCRLERERSAHIIYGILTAK
jgi:hypothetical protein